MVDFKPEEKSYLEKIVGNFNHKVKSIEKKTCGIGWEQLVIKIGIDTTIEFPSFKEGENFRGMMANIPYTLKDLGLE